MVGFRFLLRLEFSAEEGLVKQPNLSTISRCLVQQKIIFIKTVETGPLAVHYLVLNQQFYPSLN